MSVWEFDSFPNFQGLLMYSTNTIASFENSTFCFFFLFKKKKKSKSCIYFSLPRYSTDDGSLRLQSTGRHLVPRSITRKLAVKSLCWSQSLCKRTRCVAAVDALRYRVRWSTHTNCVSKLFISFLRPEFFRKWPVLAGPCASAVRRLTAAQ